MVCSRATQEQLPSASISNISDALPIVSTSYKITRKRAKPFIKKTQIAFK
jgi:hypothetical protein